MANVALANGSVLADPALEGGLRSPLHPRRRIRAVLFDVDGTMYRHAPVRMLMAFELLTLLRSPLEAPRRWRALAGYRRAQEDLRGHAKGSISPDSQISVAAARAGLSVQEVERVVQDWMFDRPLKYLHRFQAGGLVRVLELLERHQVRAGVLSDYPPHGKLRALGLDGRFSLVLSATDPEIACFKPHPRGFLQACERWGLQPEEVLMIGDRIDVDAAGAAAAGMPSVIIGGIGRRAVLPANCLVLPSFERLHDVLDSRP